MKTKTLILIATLALGCLPVLGQGTFVYDQQSATEGTPQDGGGFLQSQPFGQSFTPTNSSVGFVRLWLYDGNPGNSLGAMVYINLRSNSISGPIMSSTDPVFMSDNFGIGSNGYVNFFFTVPVSVNAGITYYFQPVVQSGGDTWVAAGGTYGYLGGAMYCNGNATAQDLWFREGIYVVPEPSALALLAGSGVLFYVRRAKTRK